MPDYLKGKIYKIVNLNNNEIYVGSTCEPTLARRLSTHVANYKAFLAGKQSYNTSFKIIEGGYYDIQLLENFPCNNKDELHAKEGIYMKNIKCVNRCIAGRSRKQYYAENKKMLAEKKRNKYDESQKEKKKAYYTKNIEKIKEKRDRSYAERKLRSLQTVEQTNIASKLAELEKLEEEFNNI